MKVFAVLYSFFPEWMSSVKLTRYPLSWLILPQNISTLQFLLQLGKILKSQLFPQVWRIVALWWRELHIRHNHWLSAAIYCSVKQYKVRVIISIYRAAVFVSGETLQYWRWSWRSQIRPHTHCSSCQLTAIIICWPHTETLHSLYWTQTHKRHIMYYLTNIW